MCTIRISKREAVQNLLALADVAMANGDQSAAERAISLVYLMFDQLAEGWNLRPSAGRSFLGCD